MSDFFNRVRSGAGKAAFEADKLRRTQAIQLKIRSLNQETEKVYTQVGRVAYTLYQQEQVGQPELKAACDRLAAVFAQIAAHEQEIERIKAEVFVDTAVAGIQYGHICPNGHGQIAPQDYFCQVCGAKAIDVPPPTGLACPHCHAPLQPGARFCANCGQSVPLAAATAPVSNPCPNCGAPLLPDAAFCTECGHKVATSEPLSEEVAEVGDTAVPDPLSPAVEGETPDMATVAEEETAVTTPPDEPSPPASPATCAVCGALLVASAAFCTECGHHLN
ncbi:MAG: zinc ribbon domain-containing protein [Anaerolineae bacterium]|nr:zinc ribbon domain-containing protein [Anaerolineae bacterium]